MMTDEQQKIIEHKKKPAFVIAGPGTGKTESLGLRVQHLIERGGVPPERILLLTFSKTAVLNMNERLTGFDVGNVRCSTTHAFGLSLIMEYWRELEFTAKPKVKIKQSKRQLGFFVKKVAEKHQVNARKLSEAIDTVIKKRKNSNQIRQSKDLARSIAEVLNRYQNSKLRKNWVDYADMLDLSTQLLKSRPDILKKVGVDIDHLLVDEVQDMKEKECQLLYYLAKSAKSAVLVGDKKQNIYAFRGAKPQCLRKLEKYLKPAVYHLTESFRLPSQMLPLVNAIGVDINDDPKLTSNQKGFIPCFFRSANNDEQADFVAGEIKKLLAKGVPANEIAVLGHTSRSLILLKTPLTINGVQSVENYCLSKDEPAKVLKALIWIAKWKVKTAKKGQRQFKPVNALTRLLENTGLTKQVQKQLHCAICDEGWGRLHVPKKKHGDTLYRKIMRLRKAVEDAATLEPESGVQLLMDAITPFLGSRFGKKERLIIARDFSLIKTQIPSYRTWADLKVKELPTTYTDSGVELVTCHGAKGREWQYVFLINVIDGEFPFYFKKTEVKLEEERRLFYVAASRASKKLFIVESPVYKNNYARNRQKFHTNLESESVFVTDYRSKLRVVK